MALAQGRRALLVRDYRGRYPFSLWNHPYDAEFPSLRKGLCGIWRRFYCPVTFMGMGDRPEEPRPMRWDRSRNLLGRSVCDPLESQKLVLLMTRR